MGWLSKALPCPLPIICGSQNRGGGTEPEQSLYLSAYCSTCMVCRYGRSRPGGCPDVATRQRTGEISVSDIMCACDTPTPRTRVPLRRFFFFFNEKRSLRADRSIDGSALVRPAAKHVELFAFVIKTRAGFPPLSCASLLPLSPLSTHSNSAATSGVAAQNKCRCFRRNVGQTQAGHDREHHAHAARPWLAPSCSAL